MSVDKKDMQRIQEHVEKALSHDPLVVSIQLIEEIRREDYWENIYVILWFAKDRQPAFGQYGTHRACINEEKVMIVGGRFDMQLDTAKADFEDRVR